METLSKKLPNRAYAHCNVSGLDMGAKDCGRGIPTEESE